MCEYPTKCPTCGRKLKRDYDAETHEPAVIPYLYCPSEKCDYAIRTDKPPEQ